MIPPPVDGDEQWIQANTKIYSRHGHLYLTPARKQGERVPVEGADVAANVDFNKFVKEVGFDTSDVWMNKKRWHLIQFADPGSADAVFTALSLTCDIVGVGVNVDGHCSAIARSSNYIRPDLSAINVTNHFYPKIRGHVNTDDLMCSLCLAWGKTLLRFITNFEFIFPHYDTTTVMAEWALLSDAQVQDDILNCRAL